MRTKKVVQWAVIVTLFIVGFSAGVMIIGEENPKNPMSFFEFLLFKLVALFSIAGVFLAYKYAEYKDMIPEAFIKFIKRMENIGKED